MVMRIDWFGQVEKWYAHTGCFSAGRHWSIRSVFDSSGLVPSEVGDESVELRQWVFVLL